MQAQLGDRLPLPFCAFNGGADVFVDLGNKSLGLEVGFRVWCCCAAVLRLLACLQCLVLQPSAWRTLHCMRVQSGISAVGCAVRILKWDMPRAQALMNFLEIKPHQVSRDSMFSSLRPFKTSCFETVIGIGKHCLQWHWECQP